MTLKEILAERKRKAAQINQKPAPQQSSQTDTPQPTYVQQREVDIWEAAGLF